MKDSRLHKVLMSFDKRDWREMRKFIRSPFFNQRTDTIALFDYLWLCFQEKKVIPTKLQISERIYPKSKFDAQKVRMIMSFLHKAIEQYFIWTEVELQKTQMQSHIIKAYSKRSLKKHVEKSIKETQISIDKQAIRNAEAFYNKFQLLREKQIFETSEKRFVSQNFEEISNNLDWSYLALKLRQVCVALSHQAVSNTQYEFKFLEEILSYIKKEKLQEIPAIGVYYYIYYSLTERDEKTHFKNLKTLLVSHSDKFPKEEIRGLYQLAINYCIRKLNDGEEEFAKEGLDLYKFALESDILIDKGFLSRFAYRNIVALGIKTEDYNWVEEFIYKYKDQLESVYQESIFSFNLAKLEYERRNYSEVLKLLQKADYKDMLLNLAAKTLALKTYFELSEFNLLESHLQSMRAYVRRKRIMGYHLNNYLNVIKYTKKLVSLNFYDRKAKADLRDLIEQEEVLTEKEWLLKQLSI